MLGGRLPQARLLEDAIGYARDGVPVTRAQARCVAARRAELESVPGFADLYIPRGKQPQAGDRFVQPRLAATLEQLARTGFDDFYRGDLARSISRDLQQLESPLSLADFEGHRARSRTPLSLRHCTNFSNGFSCSSHGLTSPSTCSVSRIEGSSKWGVTTITLPLAVIMAAVVRSERRH